MTLSGLLWLLVVVLLIAWLLGLTAFHVGSIINLILVLVVIVIVINLVTGSRTTL